MKGTLGSVVVWSVWLIVSVVWVHLIQVIFWLMMSFVFNDLRNYDIIIMTPIGHF